MFRRLNAGEAAREPQKKSNSRLVGPCASVRRCRKPMKVRTPLPGQKVDDVTYKCEGCGGDCLPCRERGLSTAQRRAAGAARSLRVFYAIVALS